MKRSAFLDGPVSALYSNASESGAWGHLLQAPGDAGIARMIGAMRLSIRLTLQRLQAERIVAVRLSQMVTHDLAALHREVGE